MNDFDYENLQKKRVAAGAARMKRGSKSKKCTLLSDYLTPAQIKQKHGEVRTMHMNQPVCWQEFKDWPVDLQKEYIEARMKEFDCTMAGLARIFDVDVALLRRLLIKIGFDMSHFNVGRKMTKENRTKMTAWINTYREQVTEAPAKLVTKVAEAVAESPVMMAQKSNPEEPMEKVVPASKPTLMKTPFVKMDFLGKLNPSQIVNTLLALAKDCDVKVSLTLEYQEV